LIPLHYVGPPDLNQQTFKVENLQFKICYENYSYFINFDWTGLTKGLVNKQVRVIGV